MVRAHRVARLGSFGTSFAGDVAALRGVLNGEGASATTAPKCTKGSHTHTQIPRNAGGACCHHSRCHAAASGRRAPLLHVAATRTPRSRAASSSASDLPMLPMLHFLARHVLSAPCAMIIVSGLVCCVLRLTIRTSATRCWTRVILARKSCV